MNIKNIKVGMSLRRLNYNHGTLRPGDIAVVEEVNSCSVFFTGSKAGHDPGNLEFVEEPKPKQLPIFN